MHATKHQADELKKGSHASSTWMPLPPAVQSLLGSWGSHAPPQSVYRSPAPTSPVICIASQEDSHKALIWCLILSISLKAIPCAFPDAAQCACQGKHHAELLEDYQLL